MNLRRTAAALLAAAALIAPAAVALGVWWPVFHAYSIDDPVLSDEIVAASRPFPPAATVEALNRFNLGEPGAALEGERALVKAAERLLDGAIDVPGYPPRQLAFPFDAAAAFEGKANWQLAYASFLIPKLHLAAFEATGRDEFLAAALQFILGWSDFSAEVWAPESFVWNDHAVAARAGVLADFWFLYKDHPSFSVEAGRRLLRTAARLTAFLARDINYTFKTNHGTMQSLAILKMAAYFPELEPVQRAKTVAADRLVEQFTYFINEEGAVLEHSALYHQFGMGLLDAAMTLFALNGLTPPEIWTTKREMGDRLLQALQRPDGSLPRTGDTNTAPAGRGAPGREADDVSLFLPRAGYAVWWAGEADPEGGDQASQTVVNWSYFPFMGHKHADELSFTLWKGGQDWWTSVGYWPYTDARREDAIAWPGSNAPHLVDEPADSERRSRVLAYFASPAAHAIDLERQGPDGFRVRRQILNLGASIWLVLDSFADPRESRASVAWILEPGLSVRQGRDPNSFVAGSPQTPLQMSVTYRGAQGFSVRPVEGAVDPFTGWVASELTIVPTQAFVVEQQARDAWTAALSVLDVPADGSSVEPESVDVEWQGPEGWSVGIVRGEETIRIKRSGQRIEAVTASAGGESREEIPLAPLPAASGDQSAVAQAFAETERRYGGRFLPLIQYREKVTTALLILLAINALVLFVLRRRLLLVSAASLSGSLAAYIWLTQVYFVV